MQLKKIITAGTISGFTMGMCLFIGGAILSRIIYGPQFVPPGKFKPEQINPFYFFWTKLLIGWFFGLLFTFAYEILPIQKKIATNLQGLKYGFIFWLLIAVWGLSHPLIYGCANWTDQIFWTFYQLFGFLGLGISIGSIYKRRAKKELSPIVQ